MIVAIEPLNRTDGSGARKSNTGGSRTMPMDAYRDANQLIIQFDIPGIDPDSLEINVENNTLTVRARRPRPQIEDSRWLVSERRAAAWHLYGSARAERRPRPRQHPGRL